jgi:DNA primase
MNLYGRSIAADASPHRFLPGSKGGLYAWEAVSAFPAVILVEGLFDVAVLWQAGFLNATCAFGTYLISTHIAQLCYPPGREVFIAFDSDCNDSGQNAARNLARVLRGAGLASHIVQLPDDHDPNSFFLAGATAHDWQQCLQKARSL